jgi:dolichol kinase
LTAASSGAPLSRSELLRKLVHIGGGGFAFLLRDMEAWEAAAMALAACLFNWRVLPRIGGKVLWRPADRDAGYSAGILLYPLAVLGLVLVFRNALWMAAAIWAIVAFGDGMASLVGSALRAPSWPWNPRKGIAGSLAFVVFGGFGAAVLIAWTSRLPLDLHAGHAPRTLALALSLALVTALVESCPTTLDDNLTVPLVGALTLPLLAQADPLQLLADPDLLGRALLGVGLTMVIAVMAWAAACLDLGGAAVAMVIGTAITAALGPPFLAIMIAFLVVSSAATRIGYPGKAARGIAEERGGARGARHALANGGVPAFLALMAGLAPPLFRDLLVLAYAASVATAADAA